jgi:hypothetical protein
VERVAATVDERLGTSVARGSASGRPLFAANRSVTVGDDPVAVLWQHCTSLREHRGDGHVATLLVAGIDGCETHVLFAAERSVPIEILRDNRGWSADEWDAASARLVARGLVSSDGAVTDAGHQLRGRIESETDRLAAEAYADVDGTALLDDLEPLTRAIVDADVIPFPNPMGLPRIGRAPG